MSTAIIIGIVVLLGGVVGVFLYLRAQKQKAEAERQRIEAKRVQAEMELKAEQKEREAKAEAKMERKIKAMKAESDAKLARLAATARRREQGREKDRRERQDRERRRDRERQDRERRRERERQDRERRRAHQAAARARQAAARARQAAARSRQNRERRDRQYRRPRPVKAFGRPVGNRVGKTNRGVKRFGKIGHAKKRFRFGVKRIVGKVGKMSGPTPAQRAQIARMSPQRRRMLKVCVRNRRNRGTHRDEALRLCLPRGHKKYGRRIGGGVVKVAKKAPVMTWDERAAKNAAKRAQVRSCVSAKERAFVKAHRNRYPTRAERKNWERSCS